MEENCIEIWGSILDYFFINHTLTRARWPDVPPFRSPCQPAVLLSEAYSLHRINGVKLDFTKVLYKKKSTEGGE